MTINVKSVHPVYQSLLPIWEKMADCMAGEDAIKQAGFKYLSPTVGQERKGVRGSNISVGWKLYEAYRSRARFYGYTADIIGALVGIMHLRPASIELPGKLEPLIEKATVDGESLQTMLQRINLGQLQDGRFGLLLDVASDKGPGELPYISGYSARSIPNWNADKIGDDRYKIHVVVLDETAYEQGDDLEWQLLVKHRIVASTEKAVKLGAQSLGDGGYHVATALDGNEPTVWESPQIAGKTLDEIPFVFVNANDLSPDPGMPPLLNLANADLGIYRLEADFRQTLYMQGQPTLVAIGISEDQEIEVGAGAIARITSTSGDLKYVGAPSEGLTAMADALKEDRQFAESIGSKFIAGANESGEALKTRMQGKTASLKVVAEAGAQALENILKRAAEWVGANPDEVKVKANTHFAETKSGIAEAQGIMSLVVGEVLSRRSTYEWAQKNEIAGARTFEEEQILIQEERMNGGDGGIPQEQPNNRRPAA